MNKFTFSYQSIDRLVVAQWFQCLAAASRSVVLFSLLQLVGMTYQVNQAQAESYRADTLKIGVGQQGAAMSLPTKGASKNTVASQFGTPQGTYLPVGDPPITRWVFKDFTVYFEYDHVVHAVAHHSPNVAAQ